MRESRLGKSRQDSLMEHFVAVTTARCAAGLVDVNFKTAAFYYHRLRMLICLATKNESAFAGEIEVDEIYFGGDRKGKRGRGARARILCSASSKKAVRHTLRSLQIQKQKH
jgi:transposase